MTTETFTTPAERMALRLASEAVPVAASAAILSAFSHEQLAAARDILVARLYQNPKDPTAGRALQSIYRAIAVAGTPATVARCDQIAREDGGTGTEGTAGGQGHASSAHSGSLRRGLASPPAGAGHRSAGAMPTA